MIYSLKNKNYCSFEIIEKNKLPARAYFIPFSQKEKALAFDVKEARYHSDLVTCLSGEWDFRFYKDPKTLEDAFDTENLVFDKIAVPSVWQYTGYLDPMYINSNYPFSFDPPRIPEDEELGKYKFSYNRAARIDARGQYNSIGVYRKKFFVPDKAKTYSIAFLGVTACLDLYVNGKFVGYSEGSHNTAEFLLDEFINEGENELVAVVRRFSTGTYLEAQDMFRNNGIFRDVLLYGTKKEHIDDYEIKTKKKEDGKYDLSILVSVKDPEKSPVKAEFLGKEYACECDKEGKAFFLLEDLTVKEWSAETPVLYPLTIGLGNEEFLTEEVGFRTIEIKGDTYYFNGKNIKFFGVNHHDTHPEKGYAMSIGDLEKDIALMKEYNVNAVRTSHYPPDPVFLRLCDEYGLYVVDEADIETHGAHACGDVSKLSKDPVWAEHYIDRVKRMFLRDKNRCSVAMWSLGNESGGIYCQQRCDGYLKTVTDIPVHYEGACRDKIVGFDVVSEMYTSIEGMKKRAAKRYTDSRRNKPYFLCEYCHAMGVGPGALADYVELFLSDDIYMGGCIWEWADHSVYHKDSGNFTYGGDHNEYTHDGCFCVDGLFRPDRKPYTSAYAMKSAYRPVRAKYLGGGKVEFFNINRFLSTEYISAVAALSADGFVGEKKELALDIKPMESVVLSFDVPEKKDVFLNIEYRERSTGRTIAEEQVVLSENIPMPTFGQGKPTFEKKAGVLSVRFGNGLKVSFDLKKASISSYVAGGKELLTAVPRNRHKRGVYPEIYRAPTDNDMHVKTLWKLKGMDRCKISCVRHKTEETDGGLLITFRYLLVSFLPLAKVVDSYLLHGDGKIEVTTDCSFFGRPFLMPKVGKTFELKKDFDTVRYYGRGDKENYPDMKDHAPIGVYERKGDFATRMIVPQTSGERCDVRWAEITDGEIGLRFDAEEKAFMLNVNHFSCADICGWKHIVGYKDFDATYVDIDGFFCGLGTNSCGPLPEKKYRIPHVKPLRYSFVISPVFIGKNESKA